MPVEKLKSLPDGLNVDIEIEQEDLPDIEIEFDEEGALPSIWTKKKMT